MAPKHIGYAWSTLATREDVGDDPVPIADPHATMGLPADRPRPREPAPVHPDFPILKSSDVTKYLGNRVSDLGNIRNFRNVLNFAKPF